MCCMSMYDDWYNPAPLPHSMLQDEGWQVILHYDIVSKNLQSEAIAMLEDQPIIEIGFDLFLYYGSEKVLEEEDSRYYLARSLHYYANIDGYDILFKDGSVSIFHGSLGKKSVPMTRRAILLKSPLIINNIYISCVQAR